MSRIIRKMCLAVGVAGLAVSGLAAADGLEILHPMDKRIYHEGYAGITVKLNDRNISRVMILTDKNERYTLELTKECDDVCSKTLKLYPGENTIRVWGYKGEKLVYEAKSELYYVSQVLKGFKNPPLKYNEKFFHTDKNEKLCIGCHDMSVNEIKGVAFVNIQESNCYGCHKQVTVQKYAHAPAVNWLCTSCHSGKTGEKNKELAGQSKYLVPEPVASTCYTCHEKNKQNWNAKVYMHFPVDAGRCIKCHDPHASDNHQFIREAPNLLCIECHGDKKLSTQMRGDSKCPGAQAKSCVECHNPHASDQKFFLYPPRIHNIDSNAVSNNDNNKDRQ